MTDSNLPKPLSANQFWPIWAATKGWKHVNASPIRVEFAEAYAAQRESQLRAERDSFEDDLEDVWEALGMADYEGEDLAAAFVQRMRKQRDELAEAAQNLLDWVPVCSEGNSGYLRIEQLQKVLVDIRRSSLRRT